MTARIAETIALTRSGSASASACWRLARNGSVAELPDPAPVGGFRLVVMGSF
jgi:hypothetical protein